MKRILSIFALLALLAGPLAAGETKSKSTMIDELLSKYQEYGQFSGSVLVAEHGQVIYSKGLGLADREWGVPNAADTKFRIGSITKTFTAIAVMKLAEQGAIKLDATVSDYLPEYPRANGAKITIRQLLNHTSGIPNYTEFPGYWREFSRQPLTTESLVKLFADSALRFEPGARFQYSNSGYVLLGAIIEKVTGQPYEQALAQRIFEPAGMKNTGYDRTRPLLLQRARGYDHTFAGYANAPYVDMSVPFSAGALYSTVGDLYLLDRALAEGKLLSKESIALMCQPQGAAGGPEIPAGGSYGYGWFIAKVPAGASKDSLLVIEHGGQVNGFNALFSRIPADGNLVVLCGNVSALPLYGISRNIMRILYGGQPEQPKPSLAEALYRAIASQGAPAALKQYKPAIKARPAAYFIDERELNELGYALLQAGKISEAIEVFIMNCEAFPKSANVWDSLGEAYWAAGNKERAVINYKKSLKLNPDNAGAAEFLKRVGAKK